MVAQHGFLPVKELCRRLGVSEATARRDLTALEDEKKIKRTYGGAISEFDNRFPSFTERRERNSRGKAKIAKAALNFIRPESTCFFDTGTTVFAIAEEFRNHPVTPLKVVTSNIPVGELMAGIPGIDVFLLAGQLLQRQSVLIGEMARRSLEFWRFDLAILSAESMNPDGIWNSEEAIVEQQKAVIRRSALSIFCLDASKLKQQAPHFLLPWGRIDKLLTDCPLEKLEEAGIQLTPGQYASDATVRQEIQNQSDSPTSVDSSGEGELPVHIL